MKDPIERQDAIEWVENILEVDKSYHPHAKSRNVPIDEVIDRLKRLPSAQPEVDCQKCIFCGFPGFKQFQTEQPKTEELTAESVQNVPNDDLISRKVTIEATENADVVVLYHKDEPVDDVVEKAIFATKRSVRTSIKELPSAQSEVKVLRVPYAEKPIDMFDALSEEEKRQNKWYAEGYGDAMKELSAQQWIPRSERLPKESGLYLVTGGLSGTEVCSRYYNVRDDGGFWSGHPYDAVIAWMPLPEPYEGR